ncbi:MAG: phospholipid carrier-dependent glycosyltransferase [Candidatus Daviesbacteria bacterium]|nr:phospholipid carrier-dependent glycosyltransferase [Candidatus Daviesbacteria bacterium]
MLNKIQFLKKPKNILILILLFTAVFRLYRLDFPNKYVFDEVYHAFTAKEYLTGSEAAWEWWTTPPPGVAFEWTHPPLAKEIMAASMFLLHNKDAWTWRLPGTLLGILSVYLVYLLGLKLLRNQNAALIAAFAFSLDGLNFVQSRTGMNDIYYVTFSLIALLLLLNKKYLFSAIILGLALSSKWAAFYAYLVFIPLLIKDRQYRQILFFLIFPPIIYLISYLPFFLLGHNFTQFVQLQQQMWWYHTHLKATHPYSSPWWSWPLNLYPVWYFVDYQKNAVANIFTSGNPALFWIGTVTVIFTAVEAFKKRSMNLIIILLGFFAFWLPWIHSPRIMFLYHFSPSVPFLSLALGYQLNKLLTDKEGRRLALLLLLLIAISFIFVFPYLTGIPLPRNVIRLFFLTNLSKNPF